MERWLDWSAFGFLGLLTLLDGLRRVPAGALVLRRVLGGSWEAVQLREGYRLVSWWPPLTTTLVIPAGGTAEGRDGGTRSSPVLTGLGALSLLALVVLVPIGIRWWGGSGFLLTLAAVLLLSWLVTGASFYMGGSLDLTTRQRLLFALPRLNPFAAPAAAEALLERSLENANQFAVARSLMKDQDFTGLIRPLAHDLLAGEESDRATALLRVIPRKELKVLVAARPAGVEAGHKWCPRCGSEYGTGSESCPSCEVPLAS